MIDTDLIQSFLREQRIDAWLLYDFRGSNNVFSQLLGGKSRHTTRRAFLHVPRDGQPTLLHHGIDGPAYADVTLAKVVYLTWGEMHAWLAGALAEGGRVAMEYAPGCTLPVVSMVDAGTVELVRALGAEVVSSANLIQVCVACWSDAARDEHIRTSRTVGAITDEAFALIGSRVRRGERVTEYEVQQFIRQRFAAERLETPDGPIVAANAHSGDPHFEVSAERPSPIQAGDWVLIDLWARTPGDHNIFSDITWVGFVGASPSAKHREVFTAVKRARDAAVARVQSAWTRGERVQGWQLDDAARSEIVAAGYAHAIRHRTGHSLSPGPKVHGLGVNLDNLETHDTREVLPGVGFTIEPGIYLPEFGVRLEINMFCDRQRGPIITSVIQDDIVLVQ